MCKCYLKDQRDHFRFSEMGTLALYEIIMHYFFRSLKIHILEKKFVYKRFIFYIFNTYFIN